jgi:hypothetical protein
VGRCRRGGECKQDKGAEQTIHLNSATSSQTRKTKSAYSTWSIWASTALRAIEATAFPHDKLASRTVPGVRFAALAPMACSQRAAPDKTGVLSFRRPHRYSPPSILSEVRLCALQ